jgi:hypothetical protein
MNFWSKLLSFLPSVAMKERSVTNGHEKSLREEWVGAHSFGMAFFSVDCKRDRDILS